MTDSHGSSSRGDAPLISLHNVACGYGSRVLWKDVTATVRPGQFIAVLGPNGAGKTSLLKLLLGHLPPLAGSVERDRKAAIGYVPQLKEFNPRVSLRGRDLVGLGLDGTRLGLLASSGSRETIDHALEEVQAKQYGDAPLHLLSGGEQQRLRIAQALVSNPDVLLLDEPLLSLDIVNQQVIISAIEHRKRSHKTACLCVTHEINPILPIVDQVFYIARGRALIGHPDEVLTTQRLTELYGAPVTVLRDERHIVVLGGEQ